MKKIITTILIETLTKTLTTIITTIRTDLFDFFLPPYCVACSSRLVKGEKHLCLQCLYSLPYTAHFLHYDNMAAMRLADLGCYIQAASMLFYANEKHVQRLIFSFKYGGNKNLAFMMGKLMAEEARSCPEYMEADFLVPVPLHPRKEWRRGYNQVECLCRGISSVWGTPVAANALRRRRATRAQASKSRVERKNIMGKKTFVANNIEGLEGKKLLLVDDVLTTGSTLAACIDALLEIPDVSICVMTLSIA